MSTAPSFRESVRGLLRDRLLDAAADITCDTGWSDVTMVKLAARVGVSRQTVYNEVGSKPELGLALVMRELERFLAVVNEELDAHDDVVDGIGAAAEHLLRMAAENRLLHAVLSSAHGGVNELLPLLTTQSDPIIEAATALIAERIPSRYPDLGLGESELAIAIDAIVRLVLSHIMQPGKPPAEAAADIAWIAERVLR